MMSMKVTGSVALLKDGPTWLGISRFLSKEVYSTESWKIGIERVSGTQRTIHRRHLQPNKKFGKGPSRGMITKC